MEVSVSMPVRPRVRRFWRVVLIVAAVAAVSAAIGYRLNVADVAGYRAERLFGGPAAEAQLIKNPRSAAEKIVNGAKMEAIKGVRYDPSYISIPYPNGDVPRDQGACTDVVTRALRNAGYDLQKLMHEDMEAHFGLYPKKWGLSRPDPNIDHRRVPNQMVFFKRFGTELPKSIAGGSHGASPSPLKTWQPGDIVYWDLCNGHTGVISNVKNDRGIPLVIHNLSIAREEDCLDSWPIIGHFRYPKR
jgi:uncharacterized protein